VCGGVLICIASYHGVGLLCLSTGNTGLGLGEEK